MNHSDTGSLAKDLARQQLQHAEQAEPPDECLFPDSRPPIAFADAGCPTLGWVEPAERNFDAHVDPISLATVSAEDITRDLQLRPRPHGIAVRRPSRRVVVVVVAVAAMAIAACSSGDSDEPAAASAPAEPTTPSATETTLEVTPASTSQGPTTAPPSTATSTSLETTPASTGIRYLEPTFQVDVEQDVPYGTAPRPGGLGGDVELLLDLYTPRDDTETMRPVFIYSHGGAFVSGDKSEGIEWATRMAELGYVAASINYRLGSLTVTAPLDEQEQAQIDRARNDLQAAVRWFKANATVLGIDPDRISLGGYSAGAMMSAGATVRWNDPATGSNPEFSSAVCGAMSIAGALNPAFVDPGDAGVIFHHGTRDTTVPFGYAVAARDAMVNAGLPVEWHEYPGEGHGFSEDSLAVIETTSVQWLYEHVATAPYPCSPAVAGGVQAP